jgi:predicted transcriptional regulator
MDVKEQGRQPVPSWTLMTSHGLVLLYVATRPDAIIREIAASLELTERRVNDILRDLTKEGLIGVHRVGRRNYYTLAEDAKFRHPFLADMSFSWFVHLWKRARSDRFEE